MTGVELIVWMQANVFPKWEIPPTQQLAWWSNAIEGHDEEIVKEAMGLHWQDRGAFTSPVLKDLLAKIHELEAKAAKPKIAGEVNEPSRSLPEIIRRAHPAWRQVENDYELILRYYRQLWWLRCKPRIEATGEEHRESLRAGYTSQMKTGCFNALASLGMSERRADGSWSHDYAAWASTLIFDREDDFEIAILALRDDAPKTLSSEIGGKMPAVNWPTVPKPAAQAPYDAIKQLAVAEHAKPDGVLVAEAKNDGVMA